MGEIAKERKLFWWGLYCHRHTRTFGPGRYRQAQKRVWGGRTEGGKREGSTTGGQALTLDSTKGLGGRAKKNTPRRTHRDSHGVARVGFKFGEWAKTPGPGCGGRKTLWGYAKGKRGAEQGGPGTYAGEQEHRIDF